MHTRISQQKRVDGSVLSTLQIVESVWDPKKKRSTVRVIHNCGRAEDPAVRDRMKRLARNILRRVSPEEIVESAPGSKVVAVWDYGVIYVLEKLWEQIGLKKRLPSLISDATRQTLPVERSCFAMVANRCCAPSSKMYCFEQWLREDAYVEGSETLELHHLYRGMDYFEKHKEEIEKEIYFSVADLFSLDVDLVFYDTTSLHFEIDEEDAGGSEEAMLHGSKLAGSKSYEALRQRGHAKNKRTDVPQIVVGLAIARNGLPIRSWVFRGDTVDVETVKQVKQDLKGWKLTRSLFVGDAGMVSQKNLKALSDGGGKYLVCMPMTSGGEVGETVLKRGGRYKRVVDGHLYVKEITVGEGEGRRRYVVCYNPKEAKRQREHRQKILEELREMLPKLKHSEEGDGMHTQRICKLRASQRYGKYLCSTEGTLRIDSEKVRLARKRDGKFVVHSNDDSLSADDMARGYKQLAEVERAWRLLKSGIKIRPVFHWAPHRICAHVSLTMIAFLLERLAENACQDTWRNIRDDLKQIKLVQLLTPDGEVWQVTEPDRKSANRLKQLGISPPPPIIRTV